MESNIAKLKSTHVEWSKAWRDWSFALKTMRFQLFMAMLCAPTVWKNFVIFAKLLHGCGNSSASAKLPRHPFLLLAASTLPNPGIDTKSSRGGKGQLWILKTNSWCLSCCQVTSDLFSLITSVHTQQLTGQHGESRMGSTVNRKLAASQPIQLPERFYENWHSKVGGSNKAFTVHKVKLLFECGFKMEHQRSRNKLNHLYHFLQIVNSTSFDQFEAWRKTLASRSQAATQSQTSRPALSSPSPPLSEPGRAEELVSAETWQMRRLRWAQNHLRKSRA